MRITIHRGSGQIGGCVTEYEHKGWRLFVDYGEQLPGTVKSHKPLEIEGLTKGDLSKSALLITHYHSDHIGRIGDLSPELPGYLRSLPIHHSQKELTSEDGHADFSLRLIPTFDFIQELLLHRDQLEVLQPQSLRNEIAELITQMSKRYGNQ